MICVCELNTKVRGKARPEILKKALEQQAERMREDGDGSS